MNTLNIYNQIEKDSLSQKYFLGVLSRDELPTKIYKYPCCFILNTEKRNEPGEHWLAIFYNENQQATFFDPCGFSPAMYGLQSYLENTSKNWTFNKKRIQSFTSNLCGEICLFFIYFKSRNYSLDYFNSLFSNDYSKNEKLILNFFNFNIY